MVMLPLEVHLWFRHLVSIQKVLPHSYPPFDPCKIPLCLCQVWWDLWRSHLLFQPRQMCELYFLTCFQAPLALTAICSSRNIPFYMQLVWVQCKSSSFVWVMVMLFWSPPLDYHLLFLQAFGPLRPLLIQFFLRCLSSSWLTVNPLSWDSSSLRFC